MNVKENTWSGLIIGVTVGVVTTWCGHLMDGSKDKDVILNSTATSVAALKISVEDLGEQVKRLTEQPYVRRDEFESRVSGLEQRVGNIERDQQPRTRR